MLFALTVARTLTWYPNGRRSNASVTVEADGQTVFVDSFNVLKDEQRQKFMRKTLEKVPELDAVELEQSLLAIASQVNRQMGDGRGRPDACYTRRLVSTSSKRPTGLGKLQPADHVPKDSRPGWVGNMAAAIP